MSAPSYEEMEAKRQEMIASFRTLAAAMTHCVNIIESYTQLSPAVLRPEAGAKPSTAALSGLQHAGALTGQVAMPFPTGPAAAPPPTALAAPAEKKERKKREKKIKDPNAPKRPPSAYLLFQNDVREETRRKHPELAYKDVLGMIAEQWKVMAPEDKKVFEDAYIQANTAFRAKEETYNNAAQGITPTAIAPSLLAPEPQVDSDDDDSDDSETDSSSDAPAAAAPKEVAARVSMLPPAMQTPVPDAKKEKKRKMKDGEAALTTPQTAEKKKKKTKDAAA